MGWVTGTPVARPYPKACEVNPPSREIHCKIYLKMQQKTQVSKFVLEVNMNMVGGNGVIIA